MKIIFCNTAFYLALFSMWVAGSVISPRLTVIVTDVFPVHKESSRMTCPLRVIACVRTRAGTKASVFMIVINDGTRTRKEENLRIGREEERERQLSFPCRSITRRHYFLQGRRYKWCSTIRKRPIDILSTGSRTRYARAPKSAASAVTSTAMATESE